MRVIIIGSGQLGSRHLQGVLKNLDVTQVWVIDEWESSLKLAEERAREIVHTAVVSYRLGFTDLPLEVDLCIVSGTANIRLKNCQRILSLVRIHFLLLEKILYNSIEDFEKSVSFFSEFPDLKVFVNHPRRIYSFYQVLKRNMNGFDNQKWNVEVSGNDWGLACNALHYVDLWSYLRETEPLHFDFNQQGNITVSSKRSSFIEIRGSLSVDFTNGDKMILRSMVDPEMKAMIIDLKGEKCDFRITESEKLIFENTTTGEFILEGEVEYQSSLTNKIMGQLSSSGESSLTCYNEAHGMHEKFVVAAISWYNKIMKKQDLFIPIT
jgi:hypothetical protein